MVFNKKEMKKFSELIQKTFEDYNEEEFNELVLKADGSEILMLVHHALLIDRAVDDFNNTYDSILFKVYERKDR